MQSIKFIRLEPFKKHFQIRSITSITVKEVKILEQSLALCSSFLSSSKQLLHKGRHWGPKIFLPVLIEPRLTIICSVFLRASKASLSYLEFNQDMAICFSFF